MSQIVSPDNVDALIIVARAKSLSLIDDNEKRFVDSVVGRGALTASEAVAVLNENRAAVLEDLDEQMKQLRAWLLRGGTDLN